MCRRVNFTLFIFCKAICAQVCKMTLQCTSKFGVYRIYDSAYLGCMVYASYIGRKLLNLSLLGNESICI